MCVYVCMCVVCVVMVEKRALLLAIEP